MHQRDVPDPAVTRRALLVGGAASAAAAAATTVAAPANADTARSVAPHRRSSALPSAPYVTHGLIDADQVNVAAAGEIVGHDVQLVLEELDRRLSKTHLIDDLRSAMTLVDDFMWQPPAGGASGKIGELGWATGPALGPHPTGIVDAGILPGVPGLVRLSTGLTADGWMQINLGNGNLLGHDPATPQVLPVFVQETRCRLEGANTIDDAASVYIGLTDAPLTTGLTPPTLVSHEPANGCYFKYTAESEFWWAVCARDGVRKSKITELREDPALPRKFHRFRVTSAGGSSNVYFTVDDLPPLTISSSGEVPDGATTEAPVLPNGKRFAPTLGVNKTSTSATPVSRALLVDWYALRWNASR